MKATMVQDVRDFAIRGQRVRPWVIGQDGIIDALNEAVQRLGDSDEVA